MKNLCKLILITFFSLSVSFSFASFGQKAERLEKLRQKLSVTKGVGRAKLMKKIADLENEQTERRLKGISKKR